MKKLLCIALSLCLLFSLCACGGAGTVPVSTPTADTAPAAETQTQTVQIQILATSDIHGKFVPFDYALNAPSTSGSLAQIASQVNKIRTDNTILIDCGDAIHGNMSELFLKDSVHPMIQCFNAMNYDVWVTGNHEFNFGVDTLQNVASKFTGAFLCGNVYQPDGSRLGESYVIVEREGVKIAVIGMVTPNITRWDAEHLKGFAVTDPVEETRKVIDEIKDDVDVLVAAVHMSEGNEYDTAHSGANDLANACPELDVIIAAHQHKQVAGTEVNGVLIVENAGEGKSLAQVNLTLEKDAQGRFQRIARESTSISVADSEPDAQMIQVTAEADARAKENAEAVIGTLVNGPLVAENEIQGIPRARLEPTALINLINEVQTYYSGADVSSAALFRDNANLQSGNIRNCDIANVFCFSNTLYKLEMTGAQLKRYMEWSAGYYNQYHDGDLTISFAPDSRGYQYDMFSGVNYKINIAKEPGERIEDLTWPDGRPVAPDDVLTIAVNSYCASTGLTQYGMVYQEEEDLPKVLEIDVRGDIGGVRELIADYIITVKNGILDGAELATTANWEIIGNDWDEALHQQAVEHINNGTICLKDSEDGHQRNLESITVEDLK